MYFSSFGYILLFLPIVFLGCQLARRLPMAKAPQIFLLLASMFFYGWSKPSHLAYLLASVLVNWQLARWIEGATGDRRKRILQLGLVLNIGYLCTFKYLTFFIGNIPYFAHHHIFAPEFAFPLGISFFTLAQVMYLVDCYEELIPASNLFDHATFVSFFPYVISGPISRAKRILHQFPVLNGAVRPSADILARGMYLFSMGMVKKVVLADAFSKIADNGFGNFAGLSMLEAWCVASAYALQLYFDFSGYTDMAIASALFLGIEIPRNFDAPLRSRSIIEFWQRWHITLSSFITTYLYTPILKSFKRATLATAAIATLLAMTIAGLWHGPNWTFVIFGAIHGAGLAANQYWKKKKMPTLPNPVAWLLTFALLDISFVFFRSPDLHSAMLYLPHLVSWHHPLGRENLALMNGQGLTIYILSLTQAAGVIAAFFGKSTDELARAFKPSWFNYAATVACILLGFLYLNSNAGKPFVYFGF
jgi:D-alanyl-lipoteichoic acid acyltransferase DltB (MBOAT superfamily)